MKLPAEWEAIIANVRPWAGHPEAVRDAVERCYTLANKPPKELTLTEANAAYLAGCANGKGHDSGLRAVIAAHIRKQSEPERVKFRAARCKRNHREIQVIPADSELNDHDWEWLEPEQSFEVVLP